MAPNFIRAAALALRVTSSAICPALPTCPQDDQCSFTNNGISLQVSCATDYYGGDVALAQTSTLSGCMRACSVRSDCVAASYVGQNCYLKNKLNTGQANVNVVGIAITSRSSAVSPVAGAQQTCPNSFTCPQNDGCSFVDGTRTLMLACGSDFYGGDLESQDTESFQACTQVCAKNMQCVAASFVGGAGSGRCYLKSEKLSAIDNDAVDAVYMVTPSVKSSSDVETLSATTPAMSFSAVFTAAESSSTTSTTIVSTSSSPPTASNAFSAPTISTGDTSTSSATLISTSSSVSSSSDIPDPSAATPSSVMSANPSSSTPASPLPSNFCLRPITANSGLYGFIIRSLAAGTNLIMENPSTSTYPIAFFELQSSGRIVTTNGYPLSNVPPATASSQNVRPYQQATINANPSLYIQQYCTIAASNVLKCVARNAQSTWNAFSWNGVNLILKTSTTEAISSSNIALDIGVFYGDKCIVGSRI